jgi:hypothetical protein
MPIFHHQKCFLKISLLQCFTFHQKIRSHMHAAILHVYNIYLHSNLWSMILEWYFNIFNGAILSWFIILVYNNVQGDWQAMSHTCTKNLECLK